jgi:uncharacterized membrane protein YdcZ (DUF606 family)
MAWTTSGGGVLGRGNRSGPTFESWIVGAIILIIGVVMIEERFPWTSPWLAWVVGMSVAVSFVLSYWKGFR